MQTERETIRHIACDCSCILVRQRLVAAVQRTLQSNPEAAAWTLEARTDQIGRAFARVRNDIIVFASRRDPGGKRYDINIHCSVRY